MRRIVRPEIRGRLLKARQRGDTIVEVLFSVVILGMIFTTAYSITNYGLQEEQQSLERTQLSDILQTQASALESVRDQSSSAGSPSAAMWTSIKADVVHVAPNYNSCNPPASAFYLNTSSSPVSFQGGSNNSAYTSIGERYWIEAYQPTGVTSYIDFNIRGCWSPQGGGPENTTGVVLRLLNE